jgi:hypothetical protein
MKTSLNHHLALDDPGEGVPIRIYPKKCGESLKVGKETVAQSLHRARRLPFVVR